MTAQQWALIISAILGSNLLVAVCTGIFMRRKVGAEAASIEAQAHKTDAESHQLLVKTKLELDGAQIQHINGYTETVERLLERASKQSEEIQDLQSSLTRALHELDESRIEKEKLQAIIEYQRKENDSLRNTIIRMARNEDELRAQLDQLTREMKTMREQLDNCLQQHALRT